MGFILPDLLKMASGPVQGNCRNRELYPTRTQYTIMNVFSVPFHNYTPYEVRHIRLALCKSTAEFAEWFIVSEDLVKAWESEEGSARHREVYGPAARLMWCAEKLAEGKTANLFRLAAEGKLPKRKNPAGQGQGFNNKGPGGPQLKQKEIVPDAR